MSGDLLQKRSCSHVPSFILMWLFCFTKHIDANETTVEGTEFHSWLSRGTAGVCTIWTSSVS